MWKKVPSKRVWKRRAEFVGGPFDGQIVWFADTPVFIYLPVNENVYLAMEGKSRGAPAPATSVAAYGRAERDGRLLYLHLRSYSVRQIQLES